MSKISVVVPCYNEEQTILLFYSEICKVMDEMAPIQFEILLIDDGCKDSSLQLMKSLQEQDKRIRYISFSRNFGKEAALYAGLKNAVGDYVAIMDVDLQDPPELLRQMYKHICHDGYDCVATRRVDRKGESKIRSFFARRFYSLMNRISQTEIVSGARDYRLMTRQMVDAVLEMGEYNRFSKGIFSWVGFNTKWLEYKNVERAGGTTKWSFFKLLLYSFEGIISFSTVPLAIATIIGLVLFLLFFVFIVFVVVRRIIFGDPIQGWASTICIVLFIGGSQMLTTGILGAYFSKMYLEVKKRPIFVIKEVDPITKGLRADEND